MTSIETNQNCGLDITVIIDRSGSMGSVRDDAIGAFNTFLSDRQKSDPDALMTVVQFDHEYDVLTNGWPIYEVRPLNRETYVPRGNTALLDAVGKTIGSIEGRTHAANAILVAILTDGQENASVEWQREQVLVVHCINQITPYVNGHYSFPNPYNITPIIQIPINPRLS